jgi:hypothetical protein
MPWDDAYYRENQPTQELLSASMVGCNYYLSSPGLDGIVMSWKTWSPTDNQLKRISLALEMAGEILQTVWRFILAIAAGLLIAEIAKGAL